MKGRTLYVTCEIARRAALTAAVVMLSAPQMLANQPGKPTEIRVQMMDSLTHRPLKGRKVQLDLWYGGVGQAYKLIEGKTGHDGVAVFELKQPAPSDVSVFVWWAYMCSPESFSTQEVLQRGVVARLPSNWLSGVPKKFRKKLGKWSPANPPTPWPRRQPGEIIFFIHPMNRFVSAWYDIWR